jgi:hypothetical protein
MSWWTRWTVGCSRRRSGPSAVGLQGQEFVAHVFVRASGPDAAAGHRYVLDLWRCCCKRFTLDEAVADHPCRPPDELAPAAAAGGVLAARGAAGAGVHQIVLRRLREVLVLSVIRAPASDADPRGWVELEQEWDSVVRPPTAGVIGAVRIVQARLAHPDVDVDPAALGPVVGAATGADGPWSATGVLRATAPLGPFAVWEADPPGEPADRDTRAERRIVVVAAADRDDQLSAWTWTRGTPELTPFALYLLHAAKVRFELRVRAAGAGRELREPVDEAIAPLLRLTEKVANSRRGPDVSELTTASAKLAELQAGELGLVDTASRLREMHRTVEIAGRTMAAHAGPEKPTGLFADDADLVGWATRQLDDDATYLEATSERARTVATLAEHLVSQGLQDRHERFNLGLTGVIGAILMVLAAMQSLKLEFTLPKPLLGGVVSGLGALTLLVPLLLLRLAVPGRRWSAALVCAGVGLLVGTFPWVALTAAANVTGTAAPAAVVVGWSVAAGLVGAGLTGLFFRTRHAA